MELEVTRGAMPNRTVGWGRNAELVDLWACAIDAEREFESAYMADPNRNGMRGGDFRYRGDMHSAETQLAGDKFSAAMAAWNRKYQEVCR